MVLLEDDGLDKMARRTASCAEAFGQDVATIAEGIRRRQKGLWRRAGLAEDPGFLKAGFGSERSSRQKQRVHAEDRQAMKTGSMIVLRVDLLDIEYRDGGQTDRETITVGKADWLEPTDRVHRAVNAGTELRNLVKKSSLWLLMQQVIDQPGQ